MTTTTTTAADAAPLPRPVLWLGLAGLIPFGAAATGALAGGPELRPLALVALAAYGAAILSFLGAVHWGLGLAAAWAAPGGEGGGGGGPATAARFGLGVLPALLASAALLLPVTPSLGLLALGILATAAVETLGARRGLVPRGYLRLRWALSLGACLCLVAGIIASPAS